MSYYWLQCYVTFCVDLNLKVIELFPTDEEAVDEKYNILYMNTSTNAHT